MSYVVVGAGAVGGSVGGLLALAGEDVTLVARGDHLAALRADGLDLAVGHERHRVRTAVAASPAEVRWGADDVVLLAVKSQQTEAAVRDLRAVLPEGAAVVSLQNGVSNERTLLRHVPDVHGVCVMLPSSHLEPGRVRLHSAGVPGLLDVGRYPTGVDATTERVARDLRAAGFDSVPRPDVMAWKHRKLLLNLGNAVDAACVEDDDAEELVRRCRAEGEAVLDAAGIPVTSAAEDRARRGELMRPLVDRDDVGSSTWQSVRRGTGEVEVDHLNGEVVLLGRLHGVPTPANELVRRTCWDLVTQQGPPRSVSAAGLLAVLERG